MTDMGLFRFFIAGTLVVPQRGPPAFDVPPSLFGRTCGRNRARSRLHDVRLLKNLTALIKVNRLFYSIRNLLFSFGVK